MQKLVELADGVCGLEAACSQMPVLLRCGDLDASAVLHRHGEGGCAIEHGVLAPEHNLAWRVRLPAILFLLIAGILVGPVIGIVQPEEILGDLLFPFDNLVNRLSRATHNLS